MKTQSQVLRRIPMRIVLVCALIFGVGGKIVSAAPPKKNQQPQQRDVEISVQNGLEKVGNFFYRIARKLEQKGFPELEIEREPVYIEDFRDDVEPRGLVRVGPPDYYYHYGPPAGVTARIQPVRPSGSGTQYYYEERPYAPTYQPNLRAGVTYPDRPASSPRSSLNIPVEPQAPPPSDRILREAPVPDPDAAKAQQPFNPPIAPPTRTPQEVPSKERKSSTSPDAKPAAPSDDLLFATPVPGKPGFVYPPGAARDAKSMLDVRDFAPAQKVRDPRSGQVFLVPPK
jgi:hypothetical protein